MPYQKSGGIARPVYDVGTVIHRKIKSGVKQTVAIRDALIEAQGELNRIKEKPGKAT